MTKAQKTKKIPSPVSATALAKTEAETLMPVLKNKQTTLIDLMNWEEGATLHALSSATGWQNHSVRGFISGTLKKKLGLLVTSEPDQDRGRVYRIVPQVPVHAQAGNA